MLYGVIVNINYIVDSASTQTYYTSTMSFYDLSEGVLVIQYDVIVQQWCNRC
jgi:transposase